MTNKYYTISAKGREAIINFLNVHHKAPEDQKIAGWVEAAETNMANNGPDFATIEIPFYLANSGHVESLTLEGDDLDAHDVIE